MAFDKMTMSWPNRIDEVTIGATSAEGGTRSKVVKVGGRNGLPFLHDEAQAPNRPVVAVEVWDTQPTDWLPALESEWSDVWGDPAAWAKKAEAVGADLIQIRLQSAHTEWGDTDAAHAVEVVTKVKEATGLPLIVVGPGQEEKDNAVLPPVSQALAGERVALGNVTEDNFKTVAATSIADNHNLICESPLDINIAKQVNILVSELGVEHNRILIYPTTGGLGYGIEYAYSIMERGMLAALDGDKMLDMPIYAIAGAESWRAKEAKAPEADFPEWGDVTQRGVIWELITATTFLYAGADILVMRHPKAIELAKKTIDKLMKK